MGIVADLGSLLNEGERILTYVNGILLLPKVIAGRRALMRSLICACPKANRSYFLLMNYYRKLMRVYLNQGGVSVLFQYKLLTLGILHENLGLPVLRD